MKAFEMMGRIFTAVFYVLDNVTIISMIMGFPHYKRVRQVSHTILFLGLLSGTISLFIELRQSFTAESNLKHELDEKTPTELLESLT
jgi:uncharacterized membrane protein